MYLFVAGGVAAKMGGHAHDINLFNMADVIKVMMMMMMMGS